VAIRQITLRQRVTFLDRSCYGTLPAKVAEMKRRPEILAPAGDRDAMAAALAAGADAVYFGLDDGFNARARATNFPSSELAETVAWIHRAGARAYVTLNTLIFEGELPIVEALIRRVAAAGTDAIIVQDPAVALLARAICPALEVHASTQMTASSPLAARLLAPLGLSRVVVPRELSVDDIRAYQADSPVPLEVFIHGALCVAWSGQCLSSEAWGGRSANRGQCAQACRLPYSLDVDGEKRELGDVAYLLSPKDLVGLEAVNALAEIGVASLKIEGRLKGPAYVATAVNQYRRAAAEAVGDPVVATPDLPIDRASLEVAYSRGASTGFLLGVDHQTLVEGRAPRHRGLALGRVTHVAPETMLVVVEPDPAQQPRTRAPTTIVARAGMGVVFDRGKPEEAEQGGPIFAVELRGATTRLRFGSPGPDLAKVSVGDFLWVTSDPRVTKAGERAQAAGREAQGRVGLAISVMGVAGMPLVATARIHRHHAAGLLAQPDRSGRLPESVARRVPAMDRSAALVAHLDRREVKVRSTSPLATARGAGLAEDVLADKLGALGGTPFHLDELDVSGLAPGLHIPVSELKEMRRQMVLGLEVELVRVDRVLAEGSQIEVVRDQLTPRVIRDVTMVDLALPDMVAPVVVPLCRTDEQLDAVIAAGATEVELDWMELVGLGKAVARAHAAGVRTTIATMRVQKPGEEKIDAHIAKLSPDAVLVRSWGSLAYFQQLATRPHLHGDFSLNVTNSITAAWVLRQGLESLTAAHDLDRDQLHALLESAPRGRVAVTVHHHIPTFHTEHCVYAHLLSEGSDYRTCGRPCEQHRVSLADRVGLVHPVVVDVGCRNTVFNAQAQSAASLVPDLLAHGVRRFRVELVRETAAETAAVFGAYTELVAGTLAPAEVVRRAAVHEQFGVTRGTMRTLTVLR